MLESIRTHQRALQLLLLLIIFPSFAFFGIQSYTGFFDKASDLIKVNGQAITSTELDFAAKQQGEKFGGEPAVVSSPRFKQAVLNELLQQKLINYELNSLHLVISDSSLARRLLQIPEIAQLRKTDGSIDQDKYRQLLGSNQLTIAQFEDTKRNEIKAGDLQNAIGSAQGGITSTKIAEKISTALATEREVQAMFFLAKDYLSQVKPTDEDLQAYYKTNAKQFETEASANVEYVVLKSSTKDGDKDFGAKAEKFANLVFEQSESLKPAADQLQLNIQNVSQLTPRGLDSLGRDHPLNSPQALKAIFNDEVLKNGKNTDAIQVASGVLISARVKQFNPPTALSFEKVKADILKVVSLQQAEKLAQKDAQAQVAELEKDPKNPNFDKKFGKAVWVSRTRPLDLKNESYEKVFAVKEEALPRVTAASTAGVGMVVFRVNAIRVPQNIDAKAQIQQFNQIASLTSQSEIGAYFGNIRDRADVKIINLPK